MPLLVEEKHHFGQTIVPCARNEIVCLCHTPTENGWSPWWQSKELDV